MMAGYKYNGTSGTMTEDQVKEHLAKVRAKVASVPRSGAREGAVPSLATSREARDADATPPRIIPGEVVQPQPVIRELRQPAAPPALKGAVKVEAFPERSKYPFRQIAEDGGVWQLDPGAFKVTPGAIKQAAPKWAKDHGMTVKCAEDDGQVYVQFRKDGA